MDEALPGLWTTEDRRVLVPFPERKLRWKYLGRATDWTLLENRNRTDRLPRQILATDFGDMSDRAVITRSMSYGAGAVSEGTPPSPKRRKNKKPKKRNSASDSDGGSDDDRELSGTGASAQDDQRRGRVSLTESQIDAKLEELAAEVAKADAEKQKYESASKKLRIEMQQLLDGDSPDASRDGTMVTAELSCTRPPPVSVLP